MKSVLEFDLTTVVTQQYKGAVRLKLSTSDFSLCLQQGHHQLSDRLTLTVETKFRIAGCHRRDEQRYECRYR